MASEKTNSAGVDQPCERTECTIEERNDAEGSAELVEVTANLRAMVTTDIPEVLRIEHGSYQLPWTEQIFLDCLRVGYGTLVLECADALHGYVIFSSAAGESHILNLCIDPASRRQGFAEALLAQAIAAVIVAGAKTMFLEVRVSNLAAINLYEKSGFVEAGRRPNYYKTRGKTLNSVSGDREDALLMARDLTRVSHTDEAFSFKL